MANKSLKKDVKKLFASSQKISGKNYDKSNLKGLPEPVRRYFQYALPENFPYISYARLKHKGHFRLKPEQSWKSIKGEEYFTAEKPGFVWFGKLPYFTGKDLYIRGEGNLKVKLFSFIKIVDKKGNKIDQGELLRWLGESPWFPTALLPSNKLKWKAVDENSARVILNYNSIEATGVFNFDEKGRITSFTTKRYKDGVLEKWTGYFKNYKDANGIKIPFKVEVEWNLETGNFKYVNFILSKIEYDKPEVFE